jgi:pimeloyl-ACP methyl ester carboxylesterase
MAGLKEQSLPPSPPLPKPKPILLCDTGRVAVLHQPGDGRTAIVTFAPRQEGRFIWGSNFLSRFEACQIGLIDYSANWYPEADMAAVLPVLAPLLAGYERVVLYGFSMGAYAALKYGARLGADAVLAFSPQYSIAPADVGDFDRRRPGLYFQPDLHRDMRIQPEDLAPQAVLFRDPRFAEDVRHAALILAQGPVQVVATPFAAHDSARFMISAGRIEPMLRQALAGIPLQAAALRREARASRLLSQDYVMLLAPLLERRWGKPAVRRLLQAALRAGCTGAEPRIALAHHLLDDGDAEAAAALLQPLKPPRLKPAERKLLEEVGRRLRLHAGEASPEPEDFPVEDPLWTEAAGFLAERALPEDSILAPAAFRGEVPPFDDYASCDPALRYDWVVLHKDSMAALGPAVLRAMARECTPVFANAQFIIWARQPSFGLLDLRDQPEVEAVMRDLTGGWALALG